jgi:hypothetical protein
MRKQNLRHGTKFLCRTGNMTGNQQRSPEAQDVLKKDAPMKRWAKAASQLSNAHGRQQRINAKMA